VLVLIRTTFASDFLANAFDSATTLPLRNCPKDWLYSTVDDTSNINVLKRDKTITLMVRMV